MSNPKYGDVGHAFRRTIVDPDGDAIDVSTATEIIFKFTLPDGTSLYKDGEFVTDGVDGKVQYITDGSWSILAEPHTFTGDLDMVGHWTCVIFVVFGGNQMHTDAFHFDVEPVVDTPLAAYPED